MSGSHIDRGKRQLPQIGQPVKAGDLVRPAQEDCECTRYTTQLFSVFRNALVGAFAAHAFCAAAG